LKHLTTMEPKFKIYVKGKGFIQGFNLINFHTYYNKGIEPTIDQPEPTAERYDKSWKLSEVEILQYIGLKDKDGSGIYTGYIVEWTDVKETPEKQRRGVVVYYPQGARYVIEWKNTLGKTYFREFNADYGDDTGIYKTDLEVIGDIYTTPELINRAVGV